MVFIEIKMWLHKERKSACIYDRTSLHILCLEVTITNKIQIFKGNYYKRACVYIFCSLAGQKDLRWHCSFYTICINNKTLSLLSVLLVTIALVLFQNIYKGTRACYGRSGGKFGGSFVSGPEEKSFWCPQWYF